MIIVVGVVEEQIERLVIARMELVDNNITVT